MAPPLLLQAHCHSVNTARQLCRLSCWGSLTLPTHALINHCVTLHCHTSSPPCPRCRAKAEFPPPVDSRKVDPVIVLQILSGGRIAGELIHVDVLEAPGRTRSGRFGWK